MSTTHLIPGALIPRLLASSSGSGSGCRAAEPVADVTGDDVLWVSVHASDATFEAPDARISDQRGG